MESNSFICNSTDEDYIDMEVTTSSSSSSNLFYASSPQQQTGEFEFQKMSSNFHDKSQTFSSPADELFYKGKLLPLHLPRRIQMVRNLIQNSNSTTIASGDNNQTDSSVNESGTVSSCISPSESCRVSSELNPDEHLINWSSDLTGFMADNPKYSWSKKLKLIKIKDSSLGQKLKAFSRSYLKSFFNKSSCSNSNESCAKPAACNMESISVTKPNEKYHLSDIVFKSMDHDQIDGLNKNIVHHRKSFSGAIKRHSVTKGLSSASSSGSSSSSSSFSFKLNGCYDLQLLKRSISANSEFEKSIEGAIAHCKKSQKLLISKITTMNEVSLCSVSASRVATCSDKDRPRICSI